MDALQAVSVVQAGLTAPAVALDAVQPDTRAVISQIAASEGITADQRTALVAVAMDIDAYIQAQPMRSGALDKVSGLGVYLNTTSTHTVPRWNLLTALRAYGLNLTEKPSVSHEQTAVNAQQQLEAVARQARGVSLDTALATVAAQSRAVQAAPVVQAVAAQAKPLNLPKADGAVVRKVDAVV